MSTTLKRSHTTVGYSNIAMSRWSNRQRSNSAPRLDVLHMPDLDEVDSKGRTRLFYAARCGFTELVYALLGAGCDPDIADVDHNTALHEAVENSFIEVIKLLIKHGCDVNVKNRMGLTPVMMCVIFNDLDSLKVLQKAGADLNATNSTGKSALLIAIQDEREKIASFLIRSGCDVNIVDKLGQSALYLTSNITPSVSTAICKKLLKGGYDVTKDSEWMDESQVRKRILRRPSFIKRVCGVLRKSVEKIKMDTDDDDDDDDLPEPRPRDLMASCDTLNDSCDMLNGSMEVLDTPCGATDSESNILNLDQQRVRT